MLAIRNAKHYLLDHPKLPLASDQSLGFVRKKKKSNCPCMQQFVVVTTAGYSQYSELRARASRGCILPRGVQKCTANFCTSTKPRAHSHQNGSLIQSATERRMMDDGGKRRMSNED